MDGPRAHFHYVNGELNSDGVALSAIAAEVGTPVYCYSAAAIVEQFDRFSSAFAPIPAMTCFAVKANSNLAVLRLLAGRDAGMDVVSEGELRRALAAGVPPERITFSGVGKTIDEIDRAICEDIFCFNVESEPEMFCISARAQAMNRSARIALRINPDVDALTHAKISTGSSSDKFGVPFSRAIETYDLASRLPGLQVRGVDLHIGSQITSLAPFEKAFDRIARLIGDLRLKGHAIQHVDLGGGLGVPYEEDEIGKGISAEDYGALVKSIFGSSDLRLVLEPGRYIVANAGALLTRVIYMKRGEDRNFLIVDAAMNDLVRPTLYDAFHEIAPLRATDPAKEGDLFDIVGPVCESGDFLARQRLLPQVEAGDLLAILSAGAYGAVQAGTYNSRLLVPEVLIGDRRWSLIRSRQTYEALLGLDSIPDWLG